MYGKGWDGGYEGLSTNDILLRARMGCFPEKLGITETLQGVSTTGNPPHSVDSLTKPPTHTLCAPPLDPRRHGREAGP
jgi:hypothetical protein